MNESITPDLAGRRLQRIRTVSKVFKTLCAVGLAVIILLGVPSALLSPLTTTGVETSRSTTVEEGPVNRQLSMSLSVGQPWGSQTQIRPGTIWLVRSLLLLWVVYAATGLLILYRLFDLYGQGVVFNVINVRRLQQLGWWLLGGVILGNAGELTKFIWSVSPEVHFRLDEKLVAGVLVILIAWIMDEGRQLKEDAALTV